VLLLVSAIRVYNCCHYYHTRASGKIYKYIYVSILNGCVHMHAVQLISRFKYFFLLVLFQSHLDSYRQTQLFNSGGLHFPYVAIKTFVSNHIVYQIY